MYDLSKKLDNLVEKHFSNDIKYKNITENYFVLDFMKALAIFFVIIYHTGSLRNNILTESNVSSYIYYFISTLIGTSVPMFFFTSGFLLLNKKVDLTKVWYKMIKMFMLIIFWRFITFPIVNLVTGTKFTFKSLIVDTFSFKSGYTNHLWYLMALIFLYSIYPILKFVFDEKIKLFLFWIFTITTFVFGTKVLVQLYNLIDILFISKDLQIIPFVNFINDFNFYSSSRGFGIVYFMIGGIIYRFPHLFKRTSMLNYFFYSILLITFQFIYNVMYSLYTNSLYDPVWWTYENIFTIPLIICLYFLIANIKIKTKQVVWIISLIGKNSLGIYLIHNIIFQTTLPIRQSFLEVNQNLGIVYSLLILIISLLTSILMSKIPIVKELLQINNSIKKKH